MLDDLGLIIAELEAAKESFQEVKDCNANAQMHSNYNLKVQFLFMDKPFGTRGRLIFLISCGLITGETQIMNLKAEKSTFSSLPA